MENDKSEGQAADSENEDRTTLSENLEAIARRSLEKESGDYDPTFPPYLGGWSIVTAWDKPWQTRDKFPRKSSRHSDWLARMNLPLPTPLQNLNEVMAERNETTEQNAQRKLHRYGAPEVARIVSEEFLSETDAMVADYRDGAKLAKGYVSGESVGYEELDKTTDLESSFNRRSRQSFSVVWWQQTLFEVVSTQLGISQNAAYRWSLAIAGAALEPDAYIPEPLHDDLTRLTETYRSQAEARAKWFRDGFVSMMRDAWDEGTLADVLRYQFINHPRLAWEHLEDVSDQYNDHAQMTCGILMDIANRADVHPLEIIARLESLFPEVGSVSGQITVNGEMRYLPNPPPEP